MPTAITPTFVKYVSVLFDLAIGKPLEYGVTKELVSTLTLGSLVEAPLHSKIKKGYVIAISDHKSFKQVKPLHAIAPQEKGLPKDLLTLCLWLSRYYLAPLHKVLKMLLPPSVRKEGKHKEQLFVRNNKTRKELSELCKEMRNTHSSQAEILDCLLKVQNGLFLSELLEKSGCSKSPVESLAKKGILKLEKIHVDRSPLKNAEYFPSKPKTLNSEQTAALKKVLESIDKQHFHTHLLFGVTGSGKTEVYLQAIDAVLKKGQSVIMLVPEISLTAQTIERFQSRFQGKIAVLHHRLSQGERFDEWHNISSGKAKIAIGARSAIFSPTQDLGLIIVDEEHENSYKQTDETPCYHARDVAVMRGKCANCPVLLGSATPSLESYLNALKGKYTLSTLKKRATNASIPTVTIVDMKREYERQQGFTNFSEILLEKLKEKHAQGEQAILFLNRRGYHTSLLCLSCGHTLKCPHCDLSLTFHKTQNRCSCHLCDYALSPPPQNCPQCNSHHPFKYRGVGTELIEKSLQAILPNLRTLRIDASTTKHKGSHQKLLKQFATGKADVLIGTQMIAKGLHFPQVTLVAVLNCDASLNIPDYKASENSFQLITQVAGRSGREELPGEVIIQTAIPDNTTIQHSAKQAYESFYKEEIAIRELFCYPPFSRLTKLTFSGLNPKQTEAFALYFQKCLAQILKQPFQIHPVAPAGYPKIKDRWRFHFLIRGHDIYTSNHAITQVKKQVQLPKGLRLHVDVQPSSTFF